MVLQPLARTTGRVQKAGAFAGGRDYDAAMRVLFYLGYGLLAAAFLVGAAEIAAHGIGGTRSPVLSAYDTWYTFWPDTLIVSRIIIERDLAPFLWDPVSVTVLSLPAWMILGLPGAALAWLFHPKRRDGGVSKEEQAKNGGEYRTADNRFRGQSSNYHQGSIPQ